MEDEGMEEERVAKENEEKHRDIVMQEVAAQKALVSYANASGGHGGESFVADDTMIHDNEEERRLISAVDSVFPDWLKQRSDFQHAFPRFATEAIENAKLVELAMLKEPKHRTSFDIEQLVKFMSQFRVLNNDPEALRQICKIATLSELPGGRPIYKKGEVEHSFYMILRGKVDLYAENDKKTFIQSLEKGQCFGDSAIVGHDGVRQQLAMTSCDVNLLLEINAHDYRNTLKLYYQKEHAKVSNFLVDKVSLFKSWSRHRVNQIAPLFKQKCFRHGQVIQKAGDKQNKALQIVLKGECEMQREIVFHKTNKWPKPDSKRGYESRETKFVTSMRLAELKEGDYFGEQFLFSMDTNTTVYAKGTVAVLALAEEHCRELITAKMVEAMHKSCHALFASEDEILYKYEREHRLQRQYNALKHDAIGPLYHKRASTRNKSMKHSSSTPSLPIQSDMRIPIDGTKSASKPILQTSAVSL